MKIQSIHIKRFRSILDLKLVFDDDSQFITICGANNAGKTNVLRAINCFFDPELYKAEKDSPNHKYYGSRGGKSYPEITINFKHDNGQYKLTREFDLKGLSKSKGISIEDNQTNKSNLTEKEINEQLAKIPFFFIPSINISIPDLVNNLIEDIYDLEYSKARFSGLKADLKKSFEGYIDGVVEILNSLADEINPIFEQFNENWNVGFEFGSDVRKFRDLISTDIDFYFNDKSNRNIDAKGSGLQRLGFILLHSRIIQKFTKRTPILIIDEPDVYLHHGLQKKLMEHFNELVKKSQIIITTHSPSFIDSYSLKNVFLLDLEIGKEQLYKRTNKYFYPLKTILVDIEKENGQRKIRDYLGIDLDDYELLDPYNIIVEGDSDKKYLAETAKFFGLKPPNIIATHGVSKYERTLDFYNSFYQDKELNPKIRIILDNDQAGRDVYKKIHKKIERGIFSNLNLKCEFIPRYDGTQPNHDDVIKDKINSNIEVEDFIYPELFTELGNKILHKKGMNIVRWSSVKQKISANAFKEKGVLYNFDLVKNEMNPTDGHLIDFSHETVKKGIAESFSLKGNKTRSKAMIKYDSRYPKVKKYLENVCTW